MCLVKFLHFLTALSNARLGPLLSCKGGLAALRNFRTAPYNSSAVTTMKPVGGPDRDSKDSVSPVILRETHMVIEAQLSFVYQVYDPPHPPLGRSRKLDIPLLYQRFVLHG